MKPLNAGVALILTTGLAITAAPTASAATSTFNDRVNETKSNSDVRWVRVDNDRSKNRFHAVVGIDEINLGSQLTIYVDRKRANKGPELRMVAHPDSEWTLFRVKRWGQHGREIPTCGRVSMSAFKHEHKAQWRATRTCLAIDGPVRVAVKVLDGKNHVDWAPKHRKFYPLVSAKY